MNSTSPTFDTRAPQHVILIGEMLLLRVQDNCLSSTSTPHKKVKIEPRLIRILTQLAARPFETVSREELINAYSTNFSSTSDESLTLGISRLRKVLREELGVSDLIQTVPKVGYRLMSTADSLKESDQPPHRHNKRQVFYLAAVVIGILSFVSSFFISPNKQGVSLQNLTIQKITSVETSYPSWSPSGKVLAVQSNRMDNNSEIYLMSDQGEFLKRLTFNSVADEHPSISPNGTSIIYTSEKDGNKEIYWMKIDGSAQKNLTVHSANDFMPRWSPDGQSILFDSDRSGTLDVYQLHLASGEISRLINDYGDEKYASWSPDGNKVLFVRLLSSTDQKLAQIFLIDLLQKKEIALTDGSNYDSWPSWSGDGKSIFFASNRGNDTTFQLYHLDLENGKTQKITSGEKDNSSFTKPFAALDRSSRLACTRTKDGNVEVFILTDPIQSESFATFNSEKVQGKVLASF